MRQDFINTFVWIFFILAFILFVIPELTKEPFRNLEESSGYPTKQLCSMPLTSPIPETSGPADATLDEARKPYHLLGDYLEPAGERLANLKSECAYIADGQRRIELTGSYGQITNNYKKAKPDNGSTLRRELSLSFYK
jgi:hypothetical protein